MAFDEKSPSLDKLYLSQDELTFYRKHTRIEDEDKLKDHILEVAKRALEVHPYFCIKNFSFLRSSILLCQIGYRRLLELGSTRKNALFLELGSCCTSLLLDSSIWVVNETGSR